MMIEIFKKEYVNSDLIEQNRTFNFRHQQLQENDGHCKIIP